MDSRLEEYLLKHKLVAPDVLERAVERHNLTGAALDTVLLESGSLSEEALHEALCKVEGLPVVNLSSLEKKDKYALRAFPRRVAEKYNIVPFRLRARDLYVLTAYPVDTGLLKEIGYLLTMTLHPVVVPEVRIHTAMAAYYETPMPPRFASLLKKLELAKLQAETALPGLSQDHDSREEREDPDRPDIPTDRPKTNPRIRYDSVDTNPRAQLDIVAKQADSTAQVEEKRAAAITNELAAITGKPARGRSSEQRRVEPAPVPVEEAAPNAFPPEPPIRMVSRPMLKLVEPETAPPDPDAPKRITSKYGIEAVSRRMESFPGGQQEGAKTLDASPAGAQPGVQSATAADVMFEPPEELLGPPPTHEAHTSVQPPDAEEDAGRLMAAVRETGHDSSPDAMTRLDAPPAAQVEKMAPADDSGNELAALVNAAPSIPDTTVSHPPRVFRVEEAPVLVQEAVVEPAPEDDRTILSLTAGMETPPSPQPPPAPEEFAASPEAPGETKAEVPAESGEEEIPESGTTVMVHSQAAVSTPFVQDALPAGQMPPEMVPAKGPVLEPPSAEAGFVSFRPLSAQWWAIEPLVVMPGETRGQLPESPRRPTSGMRPGVKPTTGPNSPVILDEDSLPDINAAELKSGARTAESAAADAVLAARDAEKVAASEIYPLLQAIEETPGAINRDSLLSNTQVKALPKQISESGPAPNLDAAFEHMLEPPSAAESSPGGETAEEPNAGTVEAVVEEVGGAGEEESGEIFALEEVSAVPETPHPPGGEKPEPPIQDFEQAAAEEDRMEQEVPPEPPSPMEIAAEELKQESVLVSVGETAPLPEPPQAPVTARMPFDLFMAPGSPVEPYSRPGIIDVLREQTSDSGDEGQPHRTPDTDPGMKPAPESSVDESGLDELTPDLLEEEEEQERVEQFRSIADEILDELGPLDLVGLSTPGSRETPAHAAAAATPAGGLTAAPPAVEGPDLAAEPEPSAMTMPVTESMVVEETGGPPAPAFEGLPTQPDPMRISTSIEVSESDIVSDEEAADPSTAQAIREAARPPSQTGVEDNFLDLMEADQLPAAKVVRPAPPDSGSDIGEISFAGAEGPEMQRRLASLERLEIPTFDETGGGAEPERPVSAVFSNLLARETEAEKRQARRAERAQKVDWTLHQAIDLLAAAKDRDDVVNIAMRYCARFGGNVVMLLHTSAGDLLGWEAALSMGDSSAVESLDLHLDSPSFFRTAIAGQSHYLGPPDKGSIAARFYETLGVQPPVNLLLLPVKVAHRVVALLYVDNGPTPMGSFAVTSLIVFATQVGRALERIIRWRKKNRSISGESIPGIDSLPGLSEQERMLTPGERAELEDIRQRFSRLQGLSAPRNDPDYAILVERKGQTIEALMDGFPGPLRFPEGVSSPLGIENLREHGLLLSLLIDIGPSAVEYILRMHRSPDVLTRFYAAFLFTEILDPRAITPLARLLFDPGPTVRMAAREALMRHQVLPEFRHAIEYLQGEALSENPLRRKLACQALARFRDTTAIDLLIQRLGDPHPDVPPAAREALIELTRHDFGLDIQAWIKWRDENRAVHRVHWLIDALSSTSPQLRQLADTELRRIVPHGFGFNAMGRPDERVESITQWESWWEHEGRQRFR
ncbi:MAG: hypothetical protein GMKNLPBB_00919 [Myxococcota bacterium]|nr:hypothetical protein [Myxococcota bacterium]